MSYLKKKVNKESLLIYPLLLESTVGVANSCTQCIRKGKIQELEVGLEIFLQPVNTRFAWILLFIKRKY